MTSEDQRKANRTRLEPQLHAAGNPASTADLSATAIDQKLN